MVNLDHIRMNARVQKELQGIPRFDFEQNLLRAVYQQMRMHSLGKKAVGDTSKEAVLLQALKFILKEQPSFVPQLDLQIFESTKLVKLAQQDSKLTACIQKVKKNNSYDSDD